MFRPRGLLAAADADELGAFLAQAMDEGPHDIVVDVSGIQLVDSHGLEVLAEAAERMIQQGLILKLVGADATLTEILELTELAPLFEHSASVEAAIGTAQ